MSNETVANIGAIKWNKIPEIPGPQRDLIKRFQILNSEGTTSVQ